MSDSTALLETPAATQHDPDWTHWAPRVSRLQVSAAPAEAINLNVAGHRLIGPLQGFGQLWQKTYRVRLDDASVTPAELIREWKVRFGEFWPAGNRFYSTLTGIQAGEVALINLSPMPGPVKLSTGVMVIYADDESFTFMNPEGHMFAGWITFSAHLERGRTVAQVRVLVRASDPAWELVMRLFAYRREDEFWRQTLTNLAGHFGTSDPDYDMQAEKIDPRLQWTYALSIWRNAAMWSGLYALTAPIRWARAQLNGSTA
jgi:hypothetical protein